LLSKYNKVLLYFFLVYYISSEIICWDNCQKLKLLTINYQTSLHWA
jgi:hypothetical protein